MGLRETEDLDAEFTTTAITEGDEEELITAQPSRPTSAQGNGLTSLLVEALLSKATQARA